MTTLYFGDNGRITCGDIHCAGMTAYGSSMTRDLSGGWMQAITETTAAEFERLTGRRPACEGCGKEV